MDGRCAREQRQGWGYLGCAFSIHVAAVIAWKCVSKHAHTLLRYPWHRTPNPQVVRDSDFKLMYKHDGKLHCFRARCTLDAPTEVRSVLG